MSFLRKYNKGTLGGEVSSGTASIPGKDDDRKIFVGGLSPQTTEDVLREYFGKFGEIESLTVKVDHYTGQSRCFAFIVFFDANSIEILLASGDHYINRRKVDPKKVLNPPDQRRVFVGGLIPEMTDEDIKNFFSQFGLVLDVQSPYDKLKNQRKGFCFITFASKDTVCELLKMPKQVINGKAVDIRKIIPKPPKPDYMWGGYSRFYMKPWLTVNNRNPTNYGYRGDYPCSYDAYAAYGDYRYYQPFSGIPSNYQAVQPQPSGDNHTSGTVRSPAPPTGSRGAGSSGGVQFQRHQPY